MVFGLTNLGRHVPLKINMGFVKIWRKKLERILYYPYGAKIYNLYNPYIFFYIFLNIYKQYIIIYNCLINLNIINYKYYIFILIFDDVKFKFTKLI